MLSSWRGELDLDSAREDDSQPPSRPVPNLKGGILYSRCPCIETRHLARQVGGASAGFVFSFIDLKFIVKFCVELSVRVKICSKAPSSFGTALVSALAKRGTKSDVQDDKEEKGKGSP